MATSSNSNSNTVPAATAAYCCRLCLDNGRGVVRHFTSKKNMKSHLAIHGLGTLRCTHCPYVGRRRKDCERHAQQEGHPGASHFLDPALNALVDAEVRECELPHTTPWAAAPAASAAAEHAAWVAALVTAGRTVPAGALPAPATATTTPAPSNTASGPVITQSASLSAAVAGPGTTAVPAASINGSNAELPIAPLALWRPAEFFTRDVASFGPHDVSGTPFPWSNGMGSRSPVSWRDFLPDLESGEESGEDGMEVDEEEGMEIDEEEDMEDQEDMGEDDEECDEEEE